MNKLKNEINILSFKQDILYNDEKNWWDDLLNLKEKLMFQQF